MNQGLVCVADFSDPGNLQNNVTLCNNSPLSLHHSKKMMSKAKPQAVVPGSKPLSSSQVGPHVTGNQDFLNGGTTGEAHHTSHHQRLSDQHLSDLKADSEKFIRILQNNR
jgi:hypothetical protein